MDVLMFQGLGNYGSEDAANAQRQGMSRGSESVRITASPAYIPLQPSQEYAQHPFAPVSHAD